MAKSKTEEESKGNLPQAQLLSYLKTTKEDHYNFEESNDYKVPSSSLILTNELGGGISPGAHRASGVSAGGKTSCTLDFMLNFLKRGPGHRGLYIKSEGRLSEEMKARTGVKFTIDANEWTDGTCFVFECNVYETVFGLMGDLIRNNPTGTKYFIIIDSLDMMGKKEDLAKPYGEAAQVAGGALLTSLFLKKTSVALAKRGHICWFISQVRDSIKLNPYDKTPQRQTNGSGGHAIEHAGDFVLEFQPRFNDDIIREGADKNSKPIGHYCKIKIIKSNNERYGEVCLYPIKYGRTNGQSVWIEREIVDLMLQFEKLTKKAAWLNFDEAFISETKKNTGIELPKTFQGIDTIYKLIEDNPDLNKYLFNYFYNIINIANTKGITINSL